MSAKGHKRTSDNFSLPELRDPELMRLGGGAAKVTGNVIMTTEATTDAGELCLYFTPDRAALRCGLAFPIISH
jgi:hypothetical protein